MASAGTLGSQAGIAAAIRRRAYIIISNLAPNDISNLASPRKLEAVCGFFSGPPTAGAAPGGARGRPLGLHNVEGTLSHGVLLKIPARQGPVGLACGRDAGATQGRTCGRMGQRGTRLRRRGARGGRSLGVSVAFSELPNFCNLLRLAPQTPTSAVLRLRPHTFLLQS